MGFFDVGDSQSRFSPANERMEILSSGFYSIFYGESSIETAVDEALVRDQFDMEPRRKVPAVFVTEE